MRPTLLAILIGFSCASYAEESPAWTKISLGRFSGYGDNFARIGEEYVLANGCTMLGGECEIEVSPKGIKFNGFFYSWDAPGFQASRDDGEEFERINIRGKVGEVILVDLTTERPKGSEVSLLRMTVAPKK